MKMIAYSIISIFFPVSLVSANIRIVTTEEPPTNYTYQGQFTGTTTDIVNEIKKQLNLDVPIEVMPWVRSYSIAKKRANIVIFTAGRTQARIDHGFHFIGPVITRKHILWSKKGQNFNIKDLQDIKSQKLKIGAMRGSWRAKYLKQQGLDVELTKNHAQNLQKLLIDRNQLWVSSDIEAPVIAKNIGISMDQIEIAYVFKEAESYIMFSKNTKKEILDNWQMAYTEIQKTNFFEKAVEKWSKISGFKLDYADDIGFHVK